MSFIAKLQRAREILAQQGRLSTRALERELEIGGDELDELIEELVDVQQVARREGKVLVWAGTPGAHSSDRTLARETRPSTPTQPADTGEARGAEARKVVTIIFADLIGSTSLHERLDPESVNRLMEGYYRAMRGAVESHGGTVVKLMGDGVMAAFGVPRVAEDDAIRAVRAGVAMQDAFRELARKEFAAVGAIGLRVGINTGEVVVSADNTDVVGDPVNVAARLQTEAHDGEVVIGESTRRLVAALVTLAPLGSFALKGRAEAMKAYRVESLDRPVGTTAAAFVGRDDELARITAVYEAAVATPAARLAVVLGSPGLGKSRLFEEFARRLGDAASVITAQCDAAGGATFAPVAEGLREFLLGSQEGGRVPLLTKEGLASQGDALGSRLAAPSGLSAEHTAEDQQPQRGDQPVARGNAPGGGGGVGDVGAVLEAVVSATAAERTRIIDGITALLAGSPASPEETFFIIRRFLAALTARRPIVLVIDDLQWAEPLLLDLVEHLVQWGSGTPLLVLVGARPELRDLRSSLATPGGFVADVVTLSGLDAGAAMRLAANVIGAADLPAAVAAKVLATSEGNPLFVGELVRMLVDEGAIERQGERWVVGANLASLEMPPTIHALLAARIERLRPEERTVLERAAVVGRHFSRSAVAALLGRNGSELDARLEALRRTELIERDTGWFLGEPVLRFHHVLIRDAAYRRLLKGTRAELHEHLADWIEAQVKDAPEHDETIGWHLEQAHQHRRELGPLDAKGKTLGERAAARLAAAGRRALARDDLPVAAGLLGRAIDRLDSDDPSRAELALDWCEALLAAGDVGTAAKAIDELGRFVEDKGLGGYGVKGLGGISDSSVTPNPQPPTP
jgi:class 3 adenylate cyclase